MGRRIPIRPFYTLGELARLCGISRKKLKRALRSRGVRLERSGRLWLVLLTDLRTDWPEFWQSLQLAGSEND